MNKPVILLRDFNRNSVPEVLTLARAVAIGTIFSNTTRFPSPPVTEIMIQNQTAALQSAYDAARNRDAIAVAQQDLAEKILLQSLNSVARYAAPIVYNNKAWIEETGFSASSDESQPAAQPGQLSFTPEPLAGGGIRVNLGGKSGAGAFTVIAVAAAGGATVSLEGGLLQTTGTAYIVTDTHSKITMAHVPRSTPMKVYAFAVNAAGAGPLSQGMDLTTQ